MGETEDTGGEIGEEQGRKQLKSHSRDKSISRKKGWRRIFDDLRKLCKKTLKHTMH